MGGKLRSNWVRTFAVATLLAAHGCGDSGAMPAPLDPPEDQDRMDGGPVRLQDAGRSDGGVDAGPVLGPLIQVLSPVATDDPNSTSVVTGATVTVRCEIAKNPKGESVDAKTAKVAIYSGDEKKALITQVATTTNEANVFAAENVSLADVPHGAIRIECSASDVATKVQSSATSVYTLYDQGPKVTFLMPVDNGYVAANAPAVVRFRVEAQPLTDNDPGAELSEITASVGGKEVPVIEPSSTEDSVYTFGLDFKDTSFFMTIPRSLSIRVDASNSRSPKPRTSTANIAVGVDSEGPTISVKTPARVNNVNPIVSGKVDVVLEVKDALAGVNPGSVLMQIKKDDGGTQTYMAQLTAKDTYEVSFDTGSFPDKPGLSFTLQATDNVGIASQSSLTVDVDTTPPWISLDPPPVRELAVKMPNNECSGPFDPLGDAVNEGVVVGDAYRVRVLIWDRPLTASNQSLARYAMIDNSTPRLYIQHNSAVPLLIDSDGDHVCDKVNASMEDASKAPVTKVLSPVKNVGAPPPSGDWAMTGPTTFTFVENMSEDPSVEDIKCKSIAASYGSPKPVSEDTSMTRVIKHIIPGNYDVVYADSPTTSGVGSTGVDYFPPPGWACLTAAAKDNAGNFAFAPPMRVCAQRNGFDCGSAPPASLTCTDGCSIPAKFARDAQPSMPRVLQYIAQ